MHNAPSVSYPVGRSRLAASLLAGLWLLGAAVVALWAVQPGQSGWRAAAAAAFVLAAGLLAVFDWRRGAGGTLAWDGATWRWASAGRSASGRVAVRLDLQHSLLVRFDAPPVRQWLWLERKLQPGSWDDLRRAVYSHAAANP